MGRVYKSLTSCKSQKGEELVENVQQGDQGVIGSRQRDRQEKGNIEVSHQEVFLGQELCFASSSLPKRDTFEA